MDSPKPNQLDTSPPKLAQIVRFLTDCEYPTPLYYAQELEKFFLSQQAQTPLWDQVQAEILSNKPIEHIVGTAEFMGHRYTITPDTLIPRIETEFLVTKTMALVKAQMGRKEPLHIYEIGTGSGIITTELAIQISKLQNTCKISLTASDISDAALEIALQNFSEITSTNIDKDTQHLDVSFKEADLLDLVRTPPTSPHLIVVANLPYIPEIQLENLPHSVSQYESHRALFSGPDGLDLYRMLIKQVDDINNNGKYQVIHEIYEIDPSQSVFFTDHGYTVSQDHNKLNRYAWR